ncbi:hypothetical protein J6590_097224, partial [Homalodisca vitripennis]
ERRSVLTPGAELLAAAALFIKLSMAMFIIHTPDQTFAIGSEANQKTVKEPPKGSKSVPLYTSSVNTHSLKQRASVLLIYRPEGQLICEGMCEVSYPSVRSSHPLTCLRLFLHPLDCQVTSIPRGSSATWIVLLSCVPPRPPRRDCEGKCYDLLSEFLYGDLWLFMTCLTRGTATFARTNVINACKQV